MNQETRQAASEWDEAERRISAVASQMYAARRQRNEKRAKLQRLLEAEARRLERSALRRRARA